MNINIIDHIEIETGAQPVCSIIWLHGLGADGHDFEPIVPSLRSEQDAPIRFIFPHAPVRPITINGNAEMRGWYDLVSMDFGHEQDRNGIEHSAGLVRELIENEIRRGMKSENIFLAGFSQGGAIALHTGLRLDHQLAGIIGLSTYLPLAESCELERSPANQNTPIMLAHGEHDPLIPIHLARSSKELLEKLGYSIRWHEYSIEHTVSPKEIDDVADFLRACMSPDR